MQPKLSNSANDTRERRNFVEGLIHLPPESRGENTADAEQGCQENVKRNDAFSEVTEASSRGDSRAVEPPVRSALYQVARMGFDNEPYFLAGHEVQRVPRGQCQV